LPRPGQPFDTGYVDGCPGLGNLGLAGGDRVEDGAVLSHGPVHRAPLGQTAPDPGWPLIIVDSVEDKGTVPLGLAQFADQQGTRWNLMMAASVLAMIPTVLLVVLLQKHLVRGLLVTALGGR
jgi:hypothetical protein